MLEQWQATMQLPGLLEPATASLSSMRAKPGQFSLQGDSTSFGLEKKKEE